MTKAIVHYSITFKASITFLDDETPSSVTVEGVENMPPSVYRTIAQEALDTHYGMTVEGHGYEVALYPYADGITFDVNKTWKRLTAERKGQ